MDYKKYEAERKVRDLMRDLGMSENTIANIIMKETPMEPNERLLGAAREIIKTTVGHCGGQDNWRENLDGNFLKSFNELEAAVKACEAAEGGRRMTATEVTEAFRKLSESAPPNYADFRSIFQPADQLTDEQRRMGLRSLRHMGPDWGNYDYD